MVQEERWQRKAPEGVWGLCALELDTVGAASPHLLLTAFRSQCEWLFWSSSVYTFPGRVGQNCGRCCGHSLKRRKAEKLGKEELDFSQNSMTRSQPFSPATGWHLHTPCLHSCDVCHHRDLPSVQPSRQKSV